MAPLEDSPGVERLAEPRPIDSLMRALLYIVQQIGRPLSEADVRGLAVVADGNLEEQGFLAAGERLGLSARAVELAKARLDELPTPFAVVGAWRSWRLAQSERGGPDRLLWAWAIAPAALVSLASVRNGHYLIYALPPWSIWAALSLSRLGERLSTRGWSKARARSA